MTTPFRSKHSEIHYEEVTFTAKQLVVYVRKFIRYAVMFVIRGSPY